VIGQAAVGFEAVFSRLLLLFTAAVPRPGLTRNGEVRIHGVIVEEIEDLLELAQVWRERWRSCW